MCPVGSITPPLAGGSADLMFVYTIFEPSVDHEASVFWLSELPSKVRYVLLPPSSVIVKILPSLSRRLTRTGSIVIRWCLVSRQTLAKAGQARSAPLRASLMSPPLSSSSPAPAGSSRQLIYPIARARSPILAQMTALPPDGRFAPQLRLAALGA